MGSALTDSDGRIALQAAAEDLPPVGVYALYLRVIGDNTYTVSYLRVVPPESQLMVFDIDGTLTTDDMELIHDVMADIFNPILGGDYVPQARPHAQQVTLQRRLVQGYMLIYLTGRPYLLTSKSRKWLSDLQMAPGHLHVTNSNSEVLPTNDAVGDYKTQYLASLQDLGLEIRAAYGNASTDIYAYRQAGIPLERTFIIGENGGQDGTSDLGEDYQDHLSEISGKPPAEQPFRW